MNGMQKKSSDYPKREPDVRGYAAVKAGERGTEVGEPEVETETSESV